MHKLELKDNQMQHFDSWEIDLNDETLEDHKKKALNAILETIEFLPDQLFQNSKFLYENCMKVLNYYFENNNISDSNHKRQILQYCRRNIELYINRRLPAKENNGFSVNCLQILQQNKETVLVFGGFFVVGCLVGYYYGKHFGINLRVAHIENIAEKQAEKVIKNFSGDLDTAVAKHIQLQTSKIIETSAKLTEKQADKVINNVSRDLDAIVAKHVESHLPQIIEESVKQIIPKIKNIPASEIAGNLKEVVIDSSVTGSSGPVANSYSENVRLIVNGTSGIVYALGKTTVNYTAKGYNGTKYVISKGYDGTKNLISKTMKYFSGDK